MHVGAEPWTSTVSVQSAVKNNDKSRQARYKSFSDKPFCKWAYCHPVVKTPVCAYKQALASRGCCAQGVLSHLRFFKTKQKCLYKASLRPLDRGGRPDGPDFITAFHNPAFDGLQLHL